MLTDQQRAERAARKKLGREKYLRRTCGRIKKVTKTGAVSLSDALGGVIIDEAFPYHYAEPHGFLPTNEPITFEYVDRFEMHTTRAKRGGRKYISDMIAQQARFHVRVMGVTVPSDRTAPVDVMTGNKPNHGDRVVNVSYMPIVPNWGQKDWDVLNWGKPRGR